MSYEEEFDAITRRPEEPATLTRLDAIRMATSVAAKTRQDAIYLANKYMEWANKA